MLKRKISKNQGTKKDRNFEVSVSFPETELNSVDRFGLGQTENFIFCDAAFCAEKVETFKAFHNVAFFTDFTADAET